jgi:hypothetical protein
MAIYAATIFLSAFLLFQIQPMIAKMILPWFGGSAAVWITCMLFFQAGLLGGYIYAHWSVRYLKPKTQTFLHVALLLSSLLILPVVPAPGWKPTGIEDPIFRILALLTVSVGLPYFLLSTTSPLIQAWYARKYAAALPYKLFALSNIASLLGLLGYPFLVEPNVTLRGQSLFWSGSYAVFVSLALGAALYSVRGKGGVSLPAPMTPAVDDQGTKPPSLREQILWVFLSCTSSVLLLSVTNHLIQNVSSIPFLWILPLSLYLISFILCFDYENLYRRNWYVWPLILALGGMSYGLVSWNSHTSLKLVIAVFCAGLFACCMFCHGELVKRKPTSQYLTSFYLMLSIGGALGGVLVGFVAPKVLPGYFELPVGLSVCALLLLFINFRKWWLSDLIGAALVMGVVMASGYYIRSFSESSLVMERNFYGGLRVMEYNKGSEEESRTLVHGTITHGVQFTSPERSREALSYYGPSSGVGMALKYIRRSPVKVGVIGLGAGSLAVYARPGDLFRFYEINPLVERLAKQEFTYLSECKGKVEVVQGDARLSLEREPAQQYDLMAVDAFSGDSIPVHLMTGQAIELYFKHLKPGGILALHITNSHLAFAPVVEKLSRAVGKQAVLVSNEGDAHNEIYGADWVLMSSAPLKSEAIKKVSTGLVERPELRVWTDDYNNLFQILKK